MAKVFAIANQKGGVAKTTTCINLAASLVATRRRVLLIDLDPQGNATTGSGVDKLGLEYSIYDVLIGECSLVDAMQFSEHGGYQLLPANRDLTAAEVALLNLPAKEKRLREALAPVRENYDYILIDCPPSLSMLTINALAASDGVIIPMQCEYYALEGLTDLVNSIQYRPGAQPQPEDRRPAAHHVRPAQQSDQRCIRTAQGAFRRQTLRHRYPAQRPARRGTQPRHAGAGLR